MCSADCCFVLFSSLYTCTTSGFYQCFGVLDKFYVCIQSPGLAPSLSEQSDTASGPLIVVSCVRTDFSFSALTLPCSLKIAGFLLGYFRFLVLTETWYLGSFTQLTPSKHCPESTQALTRNATQLISSISIFQKAWNARIVRYFTAS